MRTLTEHILDAIENMNIFEMAKNRSDLKRDLKIFLSKIDAVEFSKEELDNVKKCFSAITNFLERIFNPFSIKIK